ncbi:MAG: 50S ribosomal protein L18 [Candidatus Poribacteria bacterium]|nr:50S ribosomal protein L18 [Candidatus Poribacteria bacterium]MDE0504634.1 50S ribosomal protein L18 [Candidatus Poribacteria bacterium]
MNRLKKKNLARIARKKHVRQKVFGTNQRPRLSVFKSANHIYAQLIDDENRVTIAAASTLTPELKENGSRGGNANAAQKVGTLIAHKAKESKIESVVFDRGGNLYHGRVKALADAAREGGLKF